MGWTLRRQAGPGKTQGERSLGTLDQNGGQSGCCDGEEAEDGLGPMARRVAEFLETEGSPQSLESGAAPRTPSFVLF